MFASRTIKFVFLIHVLVKLITREVPRHVLIALRWQTRIEPAQLETLEHVILSCPHLGWGWQTKERQLTRTIKDQGTESCCL